MRLFVWLLVAAAVLYALHRLLLWAEGRGWIYYWHKKASPRGIGNSALEVQSLLEPGTRHVLEARLEEVSDDEVAGDVPDEDDITPDQPSGRPGA
ncbi:MAG TPA: hypothetical protein VF701_13800 [Thermoanaerobaculia bacterium]